MTIGRPPKPTALRIIQGNPGKRALPKDEPMPKIGIPKPPANLSVEVLAKYRELAKTASRMRVLSLSDGEALVLMAKVAVELDECEVLIETHGRTYIKKSTYNGETIVANPAVAMYSDASRRFSAYLTAFGMTPAARTRIQTVKPEKPDAAKADPKKEFFG